MEESTDSREVIKTDGTQNKILPFVFIVVLLIGLGIFALKKPTTNEVPDIGKKNEQESVITQTVTPEMIASYKDGNYDAQGVYKSPAGDESIEVKLTLKKNLITKITVTPNATHPKSVTMQNLFVGGYKELVIGKNINEVKLDKVSGSSLTPKGFNDAIEKIKAEAKV